MVSSKKYRIRKSNIQRIRGHQRGKVKKFLKQLNYKEFIKHWNNSDDRYGFSYVEVLTSYKGGVADEYARSASRCKNTGFFSFPAYWVCDSSKVDLSISENIEETEQTPSETPVEEISSTERIRQQNKEAIERLMTTFHNISSSTLNPIIISDSPPLPSTSPNPSIPTFSPISSRTRSRHPSTCEHKRLVWWETTLDGIIKKYDWCYQTFEEPHKNSQ